MLNQISINPGYYYKAIRLMMFEDGSTDPCIKNCHARLTENPTCSGRIQTAGIVACALGI